MKWFKFLEVEATVAVARYNNGLFKRFAIATNWPAKHIVDEF